jgi:iron complex transport system ATP-binding protein
VTHHVEEIVNGITHVLALKNGDVAAAGEKHATLTSRLLSNIFDCRAQLKQIQGRYELRVAPIRGGVM